MDDIRFRIMHCEELNTILIGALQIHALNQDGFLIFHPNSELWKARDVYGVLDNIFDRIFEFANDDTIFHLNAETEVLWIPMFKRIGFIEYLENKFKGRKLIFIDGNTHPLKDEIPFPWKSKNFFFGISSSLNNKFPIQPRVFGRNFLCLQARSTESRKDVYRILYENNLLYKTVYTHSPHHIDEPMHYKIDDGTEFNNHFDEQHQGHIGKVPVMFAPIPQARTTFCNIVTESTFYDDDLPETTINKIFLTEKTEKAFTAGQPFILVSNAHSLEYLKRMGFRTFDKWWSEKYDTIENHEHRMLEIEKVIKEVGSWSLRKCEEVYTEMLEVLSHNQCRNEVLLEERQQRYEEDDYRWIEF